MNKQYTPINWSDYNTTRKTNIGSNQYFSAEITMEKEISLNDDSKKVAINRDIQPTNI